LSARRRRSGYPGPGPRRERGVALIIALILVALAAILATKLSFDGWLERRRTIGIMATEQAFQFGMGAEALAADVLSQSAQGLQTTANGQATTTQNGGSNGPTGPNTGANVVGTNTTGNPNQVTLAQPWAQPTQPLPITPPDSPEGEPIGTLQGALEDMQGRFNLNNLAHMIVQNGQAIQDPQPLQQFQRLLVSVGLEPRWAGIARDWIDADDQPGEPDGAEDSVYVSHR
jgi:general secretion pathway protein K